MSEYELAPEIVRFYGETIDEGQRLSGPADGVLEMVRTQELLRRHLPPPPASILDVGGGPGAHARWLVKDGYTVHLVDPILRHIDQAARVGCTVELGDARALTAGDATFDVVLLLGPLYHLPDPADRRKALAEAHRVVRPGGLVAAAAISRYASIWENAATAGLAREPVQAAVQRILETGVHDGKKAFTLASFHTGPELASEMADAGFTDLAVYGVEGPAWGLLKAVEQHTGTSVVDTPLFNAVLAAARLAEPYPDLLAAGSHLLAIGRR